MKTLLLLNSAALAIAGVTALIVAWANRGSSNVVLAVGALIGATALYGVQLSFELRRSAFQDQVSADLTIDREERWIRQWKYSDGMSARVGIEVPLGRWLAQESPQALEGDRTRITRDFALRSLLTFFASAEFDWQLKRTVFVGSSSGTLTFTNTVSTAADSTLIAPGILQQQLQATGNLFGGAPLAITGEYLRIPPNSVVDVTADTLTIRNPICEVRFHIQVPDSISYMQPHTGGEVPTLKSGEARYETRLVGITVDRVFFALRAHDPRGAQYKAWTDRLVSSLRAWFEAPEPRT